MSDQPQITFSEAAQAVRLNALQMMRGHEQIARGAVEALENPACTLRVVQAALDGFLNSLELSNASLRLIDTMADMPLAEAGFEMMLGKIPQTGEPNHG